MDSKELGLKMKDKNQTSKYRQRTLTKNSKGFTIMELLVAMSIFAIMATLSYSGLQVVLDTRERIDQESLVLDHLRVAFSIIERDIEQAVYREIKDENGNTRAPIVGESFNSILLELSRSGWDNPLNQKRSTLQRVGYRFEEDKVFRLRWHQMDRVRADQFDEAELLDKVIDFRVRFLDVSQSWHTSWPRLINNFRLPRLPRAIEVTFEIENIGKITRLFRVAGI